MRNYKTNKKIKLKKKLNQGVFRGPLKDQKPQKRHNLGALNNPVIQKMLKFNFCIGFVIAHKLWNNFCFGCISIFNI